MARAPYVSIHIRPKDPGARVSRHDVVEAYAKAVADGQLRPGMRLPPVRALEHQFGISKNTAQAAYDELLARGVIESREREGVFVARAPAALEIQRIGRASSATLRAIDLPLPQPVRRDPGELSTVFIDPALLPRKQLTDCFRSVLASPGLEPFYDAQGHPGLRGAIAERLTARGMDVEPDDVILTSGSQQALDLVARSLELPRVATENPVYWYARRLFQSLGGEPFGLPLDPFEPIDLERWEALIAERRPTLLYLISSYQNPTGRSYSTAELERILELSERYGFAILEDDWGSDMLSGTEYRPTLRALGGPEVLYINSFTKKLWPALRMGYLVASSRTRNALVAHKRLATLGNPSVLESTLHEFLDRGYYDSHLAHLQRELDARYQACLSALWELLPGAVRFSQPGGGPTLWLDLPRSVPLPELAARLLERGVHIETADKHFYGAPHLHGFRVSYAFFPKDELRRALGILGDTLREHFGLA